MYKSEVISIESAVKQPFTLLVDGKPYTVELPLSAVAKAEGKLGRSLKTPADWFCAQAKDIPALLEAGLSKHHPEVTEAEVKVICECLDPEAIAEVAEALGALAFPRFTARYKENLEKLKAGKASPNAESADAH